MQNQRSVRIASTIRRSLPVKLVGAVQSFNLLLVGEEYKDLPGGKETVSKKGTLQVTGRARDVHTQQQLLEAIGEKSEGRTVMNQMTVKGMR